MGEILAFSPRPPATDWSANERGLLTLLTQQLASSYGPVDAVFGQTDSGDPWYVVTDDNQDVLVHIARIDGQFVVHDAAIDMFHQVGSLWGALRHVLSTGAEEPAAGVVVAFNPSSREAQSFLSLVIAVGLFLEMRGVDLGEGGRLSFEGLPRIDDTTIEGVAARLVAALNLEADRDQGHAAIAAAASDDAAPGAPIKAEGASAITIEAASHGLPGLEGFKVALDGQAPAAPNTATAHHDEAPADPPAEPPATNNDLSGTGFASAKTVMTGTAGADVMFGTSGGDIIRGGAGNDYIDGGGAPKGEVDRLDGGAGNDHIVMNARVVASGGSGADTFLISAAPPTDKTESLLGVVLDYSSAAGDHLAVQGKGTVTVVSAAAVSDVLAVQGVTLGESTVSQVTDVTKAVAGTRVGFDLNGDGREDAFILLGGATLTTFKVGFVVQNEPPGPVNPVTLVGQSPDASHTGVASTSS
jgi:Ca2+-binding RTX toxin-like protein